MHERMLDKKITPTIEEMTAFCGTTGGLFTSLNRFLTEETGTQTELRFPYGNSYGWSVCHRRKKKLICDIFAEDGAFTVMLRLTDRQFDSVYGELSEYSRNYIDHKYPCGEGGWIHYRVLCEEHLKDVEKLLMKK